MKAIFRLIVLLLLLGGWGLAALSLHVVRTPADIPITLLPKERFGITDTYVDTRTWTLDSVTQHHALVEKLIRNGRADVLKHVVTDKGSDVQTQLIDALQRAPQKDGDRTTQPATNQQAARGLWGLF